MTSETPETQAEAEAKRDLIEQFGMGVVAEASVFERVIAIIGELPAIGKTQKNQQQNFMFRGHDDVMNALNPLLAKHGVIVVPNVLDRVVGERTTTQNKTMYEVNLHVEFTFYGLAGDSFVASGWGEGTDMGDKSTSKAMTMAFKYVIAEVFALATAEQADADAESPEETVAGGARGGRSQGRTRTAQEFDPGRSRLEGAIHVQNEQDANSVMAAVETLFGQETPSLLNAAGETVFGHPVPDTPAEWGEWWNRLANFVVRVDAGAFPPPENDAIAAAWAWAFKGAVLPDLSPFPGHDHEPEAEVDETEEPEADPTDASDA